MQCPGLCPQHKFSRWPPWRAGWSHREVQKDQILFSLGSGSSQGDSVPVRNLECEKLEVFLDVTKKALSKLTWLQFWPRVPNLPSPSQHEQCCISAAEGKMLRSPQFQEVEQEAQKTELGDQECNTFAQELAGRLHHVSFMDSRASGSAAAFVQVPSPDF